MDKFQKTLDPITYSKVLGDHGYTTPNEVVDTSDMEKIRIAMKEQDPIDINKEDFPEGY